jgi:hypothetical protein
MRTRKESAPDGSQTNERGGSAMGSSAGPSGESDTSGVNTSTPFDSIVDRTKDAGNGDHSDEFSPSPSIRAAQPRPRQQTTTTRTQCKSDQELMLLVDELLRTLLQTQTTPLPKERQSSKSCITRHPASPRSSPLDQGPAIIASLPSLLPSSAAPYLSLSGSNHPPLSPKPLPRHLLTEAGANDDPAEPTLAQTDAFFGFVASMTPTASNNGLVDDEYPSAPLCSEGRESLGSISTASSEDQGKGKAVEERETARTELFTDEEAVSEVADSGLALLLKMSGSSTTAQTPSSVRLRVSSVSGVHC